MNKLILLSTVLVVLAVAVSGQGGFRGRFGSSLGAREGRGRKNSLKAAERGLDQRGGRLNKKLGDRAKLNVGRRNKNGKRLRDRQAFGDRLAIDNKIHLENVEEVADFHSLDAAADLDTEDKFGISLQKSDRHAENAAIDVSEGQKFAEGTKFAVDHFVDTKVFQEAEDFSDTAFDNFDNLNAAQADENALNVAESRDQQQEASINANDVIQNKGKFFEQDVIGRQGVFGFNNGPFGRQNGFFSSNILPGTIGGILGNNFQFKK